MELCRQRKSCCCSVYMTGQRLHAISNMLKRPLMRRATKKMPAQTQCTCRHTSRDLFVARQTGSTQWG